MLSETRPGLIGGERPVCQMFHSRLLLLYATILICFAIDGCAPSPLRPAPHFPLNVSTRLTFVGSDPVVAGPIALHLELTNGTEGAVVYDDQGIVSEGAFEITGPDGNKIPWIDIPRQTAGGARILAPGQTVVLLDSWDLSPYYLLEHRGRYQVRFTGEGLHLLAAVDVPALAPGTLTPKPTPEEWFEDSERLLKYSPRIPSNPVTYQLSLDTGLPPGLGNQFPRDGPWA